MPYPIIGAIPPPPGVTPNFQQPQDAGRTMVLVGNIVCITAISISTNFFSNIWLQWLYVQTLFYGPTIFSTKATLLLLISRICSVRRTISRGINYFIYFLVTCYVPLQIVKTVVCLPVKAYWNSEVRKNTPNVKCLRQGSIFIADSCIAVVTDATILILPIVLVWSMRLTLYKKAKAALLLGAGGAAVAVTAYRVPLIFQYQVQADVSSGFVTIGLLTTLEQTIGFVCACIPFFNLLKHKRRSRRRSRVMANVPRTANRGKLAGNDGHGKPSSFGQYMGMQFMMTNAHLKQSPKVPLETLTLQVGSLKPLHLAVEETAGWRQALPQESQSRALGTGGLGLQAKKPVLVVPCQNQAASL
ncbi:hypothetical protein PG996_007283 [Apiospora saccharicola]|uniref:Rhodopsin domain-containing protein n=1 Tax=Apiospora saccharicola TaxID=335842 RepID=A0ABR1VAF9_9PEZI